MKRLGIFCLLLLVAALAGCSKQKGKKDKEVEPQAGVKAPAAGLEIYAFEIGMTAEETKAVIDMIPRFSTKGFPQTDVVALVNKQKTPNRPTKMSMEFADGRLVHVRLNYVTRADDSRKKLYGTMKKTAEKRYPRAKETTRAGKDTVFRSLFIWQNNIILKIDETGFNELEAKLYASAGPSPGRWHMIITIWW